VDLLARIATRTSQVENSFLAQRRGMALLGAIFPAAFLASSFLLRRTGFQTSISAYYWTFDLERNFFVGVLCAIGIFLALYKGYTRFEDWVLNAAGVCAVGVAFFPIDRSGDCVSSGISAHGAFAVAFFACIAYICVSMSEKSLEGVADPGKQAKFRWAYKLCAGVMIACTALAVLSRLLPKDYIQRLCEHHAIFWLEAAGIWTFSFFWYIKTRELDPSISWIPLRRRSKA